MKNHHQRKEFQLFYDQGEDIIKLDVSRILEDMYVSDIRANEITRTKFFVLLQSGGERTSI